MTATIDALPGEFAPKPSAPVTSTPPSEGDLADAAALLAVDPFALPADQRQGHVVALQALAARVHATYLEALVATAGPVRQVREVVVEHHDDAVAARAATRAHGGEVVSVGSQKKGARTVTLVDEVVDALAAKLHRSPGSVAHDIRRARLLHGPLAPVRAELAAGRLTATHVGPICEQAERMQAAPLGDGAQTDAAFAAICTRYLGRLLPIALTSTPGRTRSQAERVVVAIDAANERERRARARTRMDVTARAEGDGLASLIVTMSALDVTRTLTTIDALTKARAACLTDPTLTVGQQRVDAFKDLLFSRVRSRRVATGEPHPTDALDCPSDTTAVSTRAEVQVLVDARVLAGAEGAAWVQVGYGEPVAVGRDDLLSLITDPNVPTVFRRLLVDPASGALVDRGARTYEATDDLVAWLAARDVTCRFPGCTAKAKRCDVDHAADFADGGRTTLANTGLLCRKHHNRKTHGGWRIENAHPDGSCTFIAPDGTRHRHQSTSLADLMTERPEHRPPIPEARPPLPAPEDDPPPF